MQFAYFILWTLNQAPKLLQSLFHCLGQNLPCLLGGSRAPFAVWAETALSPHWDWRPGRMHLWMLDWQLGLGLAWGCRGLVNSLPHWQAQITAGFKVVLLKPGPGLVPWLLQLPCWPGKGECLTINLNWAQGISWGLDNVLPHWQALQWEHYWIQGSALLDTGKLNWAQAAKNSRKLTCLFVNFLNSWVYHLCTWFHLYNHGNELNPDDPA